MQGRSSENIEALLQEAITFLNAYLDDLFYAHVTHYFPTHESVEAEEFIDSDDNIFGNFPFIEEQDDFEFQVELEKDEIVILQEISRTLKDLNELENDLMDIIAQESDSLAEENNRLDQEDKKLHAVEADIKRSDKSPLEQNIIFEKDRASRVVSRIKNHHHKPSERKVKDSSVNNAGLKLFSRSGGKNNKHKQLMDDELAWDSSFTARKG